MRRQGKVRDCSGKILKGKRRKKGGSVGKEEELREGNVGGMRTRRYGREKSQKN